MSERIDYNGRIHNLIAPLYEARHAGFQQVEKAIILDHCLPAPSFSVRLTLGPTDQTAVARLCQPLACTWD